MSFRWVVPPLLLVACGPDVGETPLEPLCGEDGPVELLQLADDEEVGWIRRLGEAGELFVRTANAGEPATEDPSSYWRRHVVIDACGEEVIELATPTTVLERHDDAFLGCTDAGLAWLSDYADPEPTILARGGCVASAGPIGERWVSIDVEPGAETGRLVAIEASGATVDVRVILDDVLASVPPYFPVAVATEGRVFVQTGDLAIRSVDPDTDEVEVEVEQAEPRAWAVRGDVIAYRSPVLDPEQQPAPIVIRNHRTGAEQTLEAEIDPSWGLTWLVDGVLTAARPGRLHERWFRLETLQEVIAPEGMDIETVRSDGLVWLSRLDEATGELEIFRWREGEAPQQAWSCTSCSVRPWWAESFIEVTVQTPQANRLELWRLDDAGGAAQMLSDAIGAHYLVMDDGRVLTVITGTDGEHGPLTLSDGMGGESETLAARIHHHSIVFTESYDVPREIVYEAVPQGGPRGLYRARLAP